MALIVIINNLLTSFSASILGTLQYLLKFAVAFAKALSAKPFSSFHFFQNGNQSLDNGLIGSALFDPHLLL